MIYLLYLRSTIKVLCKTTNVTNVSFCQWRWLHSNGISRRFIFLNTVCDNSLILPNYVRLRYSLNRHELCRSAHNFSALRETKSIQNRESTGNNDLLCFGKRKVNFFFVNECKWVHSKSYKNNSESNSEQNNKQESNGILVESDGLVALKDSNSSENQIMSDSESDRGCGDMAEGSIIMKYQQSSEVSTSFEDTSLPEMSRTVYNLAPYVQKSETLQNLIKIGVNLSKVEKVKCMANLLMMSDFDQDVVPYLRHLLRVGVSPDKLGYILSVNPLLLTQSMEHLEQRVGYLLSKDFALLDVASMYTRAPVLILMDPVKLDSKFAFLQQTFQLTALEVRQVALTFPKLLPWKMAKTAAIRKNLKEFLGFDDEELKLLVLREPKLFTANVHKVAKTFDYLHNTMGIPHHQMVKWPAVLRSRLDMVKRRHLFLVALGRAQYDPFQENYVSMKRLIACTEDVFCEEVAKSSLTDFYAFLKTL